MLERIKAFFNNTTDRMRSGLKAVSREQWGRVGYYAALALLLVALGAASSAYRGRRLAPKEREPVVQTALSARAEAVLPTTEPTPAPAEWVWPLEGEIIGEYSPDEPVWSATLEQWQTHPALDIAGSPGEAVYAVRDGEICDAWCDRLWGNVIVIDHEDGWQSVYRGLNTLNLARIGDTVKAGDVISAVAPTVPCEADLAPHIHFELTRDGQDADFAQMMRDGE